MSQDDNENYNENYNVIADAIANDVSANVIVDDTKHKKIEVVELDSDFEENRFLRDDTPYANSKHYLDDDDDTVDNDNDNDLLYAPIFLGTSLPRNGWIQGCVLCNAKTANTIYYRDDTYDTFGYMVYCCHFCKRAIDRNIETQIEYTDLIIGYIDTHKHDIYKEIQTPK